MTEESKPGGGSSIVGDLTKVAETSLMKDLFGRSAKAAGDYYGEHAEDYFKRRREQDRKNLQDHERKVAEITGESIDIFSRPEAGAAIERWIRIAIDVPLEDAERAAICEAVLAEILSSNRSTDFQEVAERLSNSGIRLLLNAPSDRKVLPEGDERENYERLRELKLARKPSLARLSLLFVAWCVGTGLGFYALTSIVSKILPTTIVIGFLWEAATLSGLIFVAGMVFLCTNYTLTDFGRSLQRSALRFYPTKARIREFRLASLVPSGFLGWAGLSVVMALGMPLLFGHYLPGSETIP
jgi:hypothetical protein